MSLSKQIRWLATLMMLLCFAGLLRAQDEQVDFRAELLGAPDSRYAPAATDVHDALVVLRRVRFQVVDQQAAGFPQLVAVYARVIALALDAADFGM